MPCVGACPFMHVQWSRLPTWVSPLCSTAMLKSSQVCSIGCSPRLLDLCCLEGWKRYASRLHSSLWLFQNWVRGTESLKTKSMKNDFYKELGRTRNTPQNCWNLRTKRNPSLQA